MSSGKDRRAEPDDAFVEELSRLKRQGANVLVVGSTRSGQQTKTCRRLLGHATERPRRRILVSTTGEPRDVSRVVETETPGQLTVISHKMQTRSAAAQTPSTASSLDSSPTSVDTLTDLGIEISRAIETFDTMADGLEPSELRIGIDSLVPLLEEYGRERVFRFIHLTNGRVGEMSGMIHYHLPVARESDIVALLSPLFDIVIELRKQNSVCEERWSLKGGTLCSGWISTA